MLKKAFIAFGIIVITSLAGGAVIFGL